MPNPDEHASAQRPERLASRSIAEYLAELKNPPLPIERRETLLFAALWAIVAISRWLALSTSQLDWDESLFAGGVREYDVFAQHPHPPGYPLFILFAKGARLLVHDDFRALRAEVFVAAVLLFPAVFFLLRELRLRYRIAIGAALITSFLPTVWYYGGTALSDVPALTAVVIASSLFLAGARHPRLWIAGTFLAGITAGIRPLHVVIAAVPAVLSVGAWLRRGTDKSVCATRSRTIVAGCALFAVIVLASYGGAAMATKNPPWGYLQQIGATAHHIDSTDSFNNVTRPPLPKLASMFFVHPQRGGRAGLLLLALSSIGAIEGLVRRRVSIWILLAMFVPTAIVSWMMLDLTAVTRYALAYILLYSVLGACGIDAIARVFKSPAKQTSAVGLAVTVVVAAMIVWTWPALEVVRHRPSPPVAAMEWIRGHVPAAGSQLYLDDSLGYHAGHELIGYDTRFFHSYDEIPAEAYVPGNYCLVDRPTIQPHARLYRFPRARLADIARDVYFETSIIPMDAMIRFGAGWYQDEYDGDRAHAWRWMERSSTALVPPIGANGVLRLQFHVPLNALPRPPKMTVTWNGSVIDQGVCSELDNERRYVLSSRSGAPNELRIALDEGAKTSGDPREFALQLTGVSWERVDGGF